MRRPVFFAQVLEPGIGLGPVSVVVDRLFDADGSGVEPGREEQQGGDDDDDEGAAELQHCLELSFPASDSIPANVRALNIRPVEPEQHLFRGRQQLFVFYSDCKKTFVVAFLFFGFLAQNKKSASQLSLKPSTSKEFFCRKTAARPQPSRKFYDRFLRPKIVETCYFCVSRESETRPLFGHSERFISTEPILLVIQLLSSCVCFL